MAQDSGNILYFPSDLRTPTNDGKLYPLVEFSVQGSPKDGNMYKSIYLPMPAGISFSDGGSYGTIDLGLMGAGGLEALRQISEGDRRGAIETIGEGITQGISSIGTAIKQYASKKLTMVGNDKGMFAMKKIQAPNTNTTFTGNTIRSFTFNATMVARNEEDTSQMRNIAKVFRRYVYADADAGNPNIYLDYPPIWTVKFYIDGHENRNLPRIFSCYLETFTCTYNPDSNVFYSKDGAPIQTNISMTFRETRVLNRLDIDNLEDVDERGINPKTGLASFAPTTYSRPLPPPSFSALP